MKNSKAVIDFLDGPEAATFLYPTMRVVSAVKHNEAAFRTSQKLSPSPVMAVHTPSEKKACESGASTLSLKICVRVLKACVRGQASSDSSAAICKS